MATSKALHSFQRSSPQGHSPSTRRHLSSYRSTGCNNRDLPNLARSPVDGTPHCPCQTPPAPHSWRLMTSLSVLWHALVPGRHHIAIPFPSRRHRYPRRLGVAGCGQVAQGHFYYRVPEEDINIQEDFRFSRRQVRRWLSPDL